MWRLATVCCFVAALTTTTAAAPAGGPDSASFWVARAAEHYLAMKKPTGDHYVDLIAALSHGGDAQTLRKVVSKHEEQLAGLFESDDFDWIQASSYLHLAEGWGRAGDAEGFKAALARADAAAAGIEDDMKLVFARQKPATAAFLDLDGSIALVRALPGKRQPECFLEVAYARGEMKDRAGVRRALEGATAAAEKFLDDGERSRLRRRVVSVWAHAGEVTAAAEAAAALAPGARASAYARIAEVCRAKGDGAGVDLMMQRMAELVREADAKERSWLANNFAEAAADLGRGKEALAVVRLAEDSAPPPADPVDRGQWLTRLAYAYACAEDFDACRRLLDEALKIRADLRAAILAEHKKQRAEEAGEDEEPEADVGFDAPGMTGITLRGRAREQFDDGTLSPIAFALARCGRAADGLALAELVERQEKDSSLMWVVRGAAAAGDLDTAKRVAERLEGKVSRDSAARWAAEEFAKRKRTKDLTDWAESRPTEHAKFAAYIGAAEGILAKRFWEPRLGV